MLLVQAQAYRQQFDFNAIYLLPANLYGPKDHFDLEKSHVIPALIRKIMQAKEDRLPSVEVWGTGKPSREFLYVEDAAEGIIAATEHYNGPEPVNIGTGQSITIRDLVQLICRILGYKGRIIWNKTKPDGQPKRVLDVSRARKLFGFKAKTSLESGLRKTILWYKTIYKKTPQGIETPLRASRSSPEIYKDLKSGATLAMVIRSGYRANKYNFFTPNEYPLQLGLNFYSASEQIQPHIHPDQTKQIHQMLECLLIRKGHIVMHLFDREKNFVQDVDLFSGDIVLQVTGGHGFKVLRRYRDCGN